MTSLTKEKGYQKAAWILAVLLVVVAAIVGFA